VEAKAAQERAEMEREFLVALREGEITLRESKGGRDSVAWSYRPDPPISQERKVRLKLCSSAVCRAVRHNLNDTLAERVALGKAHSELVQREATLKEPEALLQAAKAEVVSGIRDDFDTLKGAWAQNEATYNVDIHDNWRWWINEDVTAARKDRLHACIRTVGGLVGWMARRFEETVNEVVRYLSPSAQAEFKSEWVDALDRGSAPQWDAPGEGPSGVTGRARHRGPFLGM